MLGKYERLDVLGHGVSGIVYLARDTLLNKRVALKEVDVQAGDATRFLEEARVLDRLRHPNIVRVNSVDRIEGKIVIDMEYVRGKNLAERLRAEGRLPLHRALDIAIQTLDALEYAHSMQTVHRDIKPANILVGDDGQVKLVDFGLAEILATNAYAGGAGTYAYMAPEDFASEDRSDRFSDIWAVGITLYEMLAGKRPFQVEKPKDPFAWKRALETQAPTPLREHLPDAPPTLQTILNRALARDKRKRYPTAAAFRDDLQALRAGLPVAESAPRSEEPEENAASESVHRSRWSGETLAGATALAAEPPASPRTGPDVVIADVNPISERRIRLPFARRKAVTARLLIEPERLDFGTMHQGAVRSAKITARTEGLQEETQGHVLCSAEWLSASPAEFARPRQAIEITADSSRVREPGDFQEKVRVETNAGALDIPIQLRVLKPRPTFAQVAPWYVPLFAVTLLPALTVALGAGSQSSLAGSAAALVPPAAMASGLLAAMLLLLCITQDTGFAERAACGVLLAVMSFVVGVAAAIHPASSTLTSGLHWGFWVGVALGAILLLQLLFPARWRVWAGVLVCLSLLVSGTLLRALQS